MQHRKFMEQTAAINLSDEDVFKIPQIPAILRKPTTDAANPTTTKDKIPSRVSNLQMQPRIIENENTETLLKFQQLGKCGDGTNGDDKKLHLFNKNVNWKQNYLTLAKAFLQLCQLVPEDDDEELELINKEKRNIKLICKENNIRMPIIETFKRLNVSNSKILNFHTKSTQTVSFTEAAAAATAEEENQITNTLPKTNSRIEELQRILKIYSKTIRPISPLPEDPPMIRILEALEQFQPKLISNDMAVSTNQKMNLRTGASSEAFCLSYLPLNNQNDIRIKRSSSISTEYKQLDVPIAAECIKPEMEICKSNDMYYNNGIYTSPALKETLNSWSNQNFAYNLQTADKLANYRKSSYGKRAAAFDVIFDPVQIPAISIDIESTNSIQQPKASVGEQMNYVETENQLVNNDEGCLKKNKKKKNKTKKKKTKNFNESDANNIEFEEHTNKSFENKSKYYNELQLMGASNVKNSKMCTKGFVGRNYVDALKEYNNVKETENIILSYDLNLSSDSEIECENKQEIDTKYNKDKPTKTINISSNTKSSNQLTTENEAENNIILSHDLNLSSDSEIEIECEERIEINIKNSSELKDKPTKTINIKQLTEENGADNIIREIAQETHEVIDLTAESVDDVIKDFKQNKQESTTAKVINKIKSKEEKKRSKFKEQSRREYREFFDYDGCSKENYTIKEKTFDEMLESYIQLRNKQTNMNKCNEKSSKLLDKISDTKPENVTWLYTDNNATDLNLNSDSEDDKLIIEEFSQNKQVVDLNKINKLLEKPTNAINAINAIKFNCNVDYAKGNSAPQSEISAPFKKVLDIHVAEDMVLSSDSDSDSENYNNLIIEEFSQNEKDVNINNFNPIKFNCNTADNKENSPQNKITILPEEPVAEKRTEQNFSLNTNENSGTEKIESLKKNSTNALDDNLIAFDNKENSSQGKITPLTEETAVDKIDEMAEKCTEENFSLNANGNLGIEEIESAIDINKMNELKEKSRIATDNLITVDTNENSSQDKITSLTEENVTEKVIKMAQKNQKSPQLNLSLDSNDKISIEEIEQEGDINKLNDNLIINDNFNVDDSKENSTESKISLPSVENKSEKNIEEKTQVIEDLDFELEYSELNLSYDSEEIDSLIRDFDQNEPDIDINKINVLQEILCKVNDISNAPFEDTKEKSKKNSLSQNDIYDLPKENKDVEKPQEVVDTDDANSANSAQTAKVKRCKRHLTQDVNYRKKLRSHNDCNIVNNVIPPLNFYVDTFVTPNSSNNVATVEMEKNCRTEINIEGSTTTTTTTKNANDTCDNKTNLKCDNENTSGSKSTALYDAPSCSKFPTNNFVEIQNATSETIVSSSSTTTTNICTNNNVNGVKFVNYGNYFSDISEYNLLQNCNNLKKNAMPSVKCSIELKKSLAEELDIYLQNDDAHSPQYVFNSMKILSKDNDELIITIIIDKMRTIGYDDSQFEIVEVEKWPNVHILYLINYIFYSHSMDLIYRLIDLIEYELFHKPKNQTTYFEAVNLTTFYLNIVSNFAEVKNKYPVGRFVLLCFIYKIEKILPELLLEVLRYYPFLLPRESIATELDNENIVFYAMRYRLKHYKYDMSKHQHKEFLSRLRFKNHYKPYTPTWDQVVNRMTDSIKQNRLENLQIAFSVLRCCHVQNSMQRFVKVIELILMPLFENFLNELKNRVCACETQFICVVTCILSVAKLTTRTHAYQYVNKIRSRCTKIRNKNIKMAVKNIINQMAKGIQNLPALEQNFQMQKRKRKSGKRKRKRTKCQ